METIGYIRVSTDEQAREGISLDNQERRIRDFASAKEWKLIGILRDEGYSGKNLNRPGIKELIERARNKEFEVVIVYKVDRLTRKQKDLWWLLEDVFQKNDIGLISVNEPFDTTTAIGKAFLGMLGVFAQLERDLISERTKDSLAYKKSNGERLGSPSLGVRILDGKVEIDNEELKILRYIQVLKKEGLSYSCIAGRLDQEGIRTKRGGKWSTGTLHYLLNKVIPKMKVAT